MIIAALLRAQDPLNRRWQEIIEIVTPFAGQYHPGAGPWHGSLRLARIAALQNQADLAIQHLRTAMDQGFFAFYGIWMLRDTALELLKPAAGLPATGGGTRPGSGTPT